MDFKKTRHRFPWIIRLCLLCGARGLRLPQKEGRGWELADLQKWRKKRSKFDQIWRFWRIFFLINRWWCVSNIWIKENIICHIKYSIHKSFISIPKASLFGGQIVRLTSCWNTMTVLFRDSRWCLSIDLLILDVTTPDMTNNIWNQRRMGNSL